MSTAPMNPGELVETLYCYGWPDGRALSPDERAEVIDYARSFEECSHSTEELEAMDDQSLVATAYIAMADYARGQM